MTKDDNKKEISVQEYLEQQKIREETDRKLNDRKQGKISKLVDKLIKKAADRPLHKVSKKAYIILAVFGGWLGLHRFYEKRYILGILYMLPAVLGLICNTIMNMEMNFYSLVGISLAMTVIDIFIVIPKQKDENGKIEI